MAHAPWSDHSMHTHIIIIFFLWPTFICSALAHECQSKCHSNIAPNHVAQDNISNAFIWFRNGIRNCILHSKWYTFSYMPNHVFIFFIFFYFIHRVSSIRNYAWMCLINMSAFEFIRHIIINTFYACASSSHTHLVNLTCIQHIANKKKNKNNNNKYNHSLSIWLRFSSDSCAISVIMCQIYGNI